MFPIIKLRVKETIRSKGFILFSIFGIIITSFLIFQGEYSVNNVRIIEESQNYGLHLTILTVISSLVTVLLSMNTIERERERESRVLLRVHGINKEKEYLAYGISNILIGMISGVLLFSGLIIYTLIKNIGLLIYLPLALIPYFISIGIIAVIITIFTIYLPSSISGFLGIIIVIVGSIKGMLNTLISNKGGLFSVVMEKLFYIIPPIDNLNSLARKFMFFEKIDIRIILKILLYITIVYGIFYLAIRRREEYER